MKNTLTKIAFGIQCLHILGLLVFVGLFFSLGAAVFFYVLAFLIPIAIVWTIFFIIPSILLVIDFVGGRESKLMLASFIIALLQAAPLVFAAHLIFGFF